MQAKEKGKKLVFNQTWVDGQQEEDKAKETCWRTVKVGKPQSVITEWYFSIFFIQFSEVKAAKKNPLNVLKSTWYF